MKKRKSSFNKILYTQIALTIFGLLLCISIAIPLTNKVVLKQYAINKEIEELKNEASRLENKKTEFGKTIEYLKSDQFMLEQARLNLNLKKDGEEVVVVQTDKDYEKTDTVIEPSKVYEANQAAVIQNESGNYKKWMEFFLKK